MLILDYFFGYGTVYPSEAIMAYTYHISEGSFTPAEKRVLLIQGVVLQEKITSQ